METFPLDIVDQVAYFACFDESNIATLALVHRDLRWTVTRAQIRRLGRGSFPQAVENLLAGRLPLLESMLREAHSFSVVEVTPPVMDQVAQIFERFENLKTMSMTLTRESRMVEQVWHIPPIFLSVQRLHLITNHHRLPTYIKDCFPNVARLAITLLPNLDTLLQPKGENASPLRKPGFPNLKSVHFHVRTNGQSNLPYWVGRDLLQFIRENTVWMLSAPDMRLDEARFRSWDTYGELRRRVFLLVSGTQPSELFPAYKDWRIDYSEFRSWETLFGEDLVGIAESRLLALRSR